MPKIAHSVFFSMIARIFIINKDFRLFRFSIIVLKSFVERIFIIELPMHFFRESPWLLEILNDNLEYLIQETGIMR
jgi:hypothetical protein